MPDTYITRQGSVSLQHKDGTSPLYRYGDPVDFNLLTDAQLEHIDALTGDDPAVKNEKSLAEQVQASQTFDNPAEFRAIMAEMGQPNSTSSPVPANYDELDAEERARFIEVLSSHPTSQAVVIAHEIQHGNDKGVLDAAPKGVTTLAKRYLEGQEAAIHGPDVSVPGEAEAVETPVDTIPEPTTIPEAAVEAAVEGGPPVESTSAPGVPAPTAGASDDDADDAPKKSRAKKS